MRPVSLPTAPLFPPARVRTPPQKITYNLRVCGKLCECRETWNWNQSERIKRGECREPFSPPARLRMLREIAQIHWRDDVRYSLITLTYPDAIAERSIERQTIDRSRFVRDLERLIGHNVGILWRKEWKERLSGVRKGQLTAHWHLLCFDVGWIDHADIRRVWAAILATGGPLSTDVREAKTGQQAAMYAAKYAAKCSPCSLDNASYLNRRWGRAWGFLRTVLIPYYEPIVIRGLSHDELALARHLAHGIWPAIRPDTDSGFTLFGDEVQALAASVAKMRLGATRRKC